MRRWRYYPGWATNLFSERLNALIGVLIIAVALAAIVVSFILVMGGYLV